MLLDCDSRWQFSNLGTKLAAMYVGTIEVEVIIHAGRTLKDRRRTVESLKRQIRNSFNAAVADLDGDPVPGHARIGVVCVANEPQRLDAQLQVIVNFVEDSHLDLEVINAPVEIVQL